MWRLALGGTLLTLVLAIGLAGPFLRLDVWQVDIRDRGLAPLSPGYLLGTDDRGFDVLAQVSYAVWPTLSIAAIATAIAFIGGALPGLAILRFAPRAAPLLARSLSAFFAFSIAAAIAVIAFILAPRSMDMPWLLAFLAACALATLAIPVLRWGSALRPENPNRTEWTGLGWRLLRLGPAVLLSFWIPWVSLLLGDIPFSYSPSPVGELYVGLFMLPFALRYTLAAGTPMAARKGLALALPSAFAWAVLLTIWGFLSIIPAYLYIPPLGNLVLYGLPKGDVTFFAALATFAALILGFVLLGDGLRLGRAGQRR